MMQGENVSSTTKKKIPKKFLLIGIAVVAVIAVAAVIAIVFANRKESYRTLEIIECVGEGTVYRAGKEIAAYEDMHLRSGDSITVGENSYLRMKLDDDKYVFLEGCAIINLIADGTKKDSRTIVDIDLGTMITEVQNKLSENSSYEIHAPNTTMAIRGTITVSRVTYDFSDASLTEQTEGQIGETDLLEYLIEKNDLLEDKDSTDSDAGTSDDEGTIPEDQKKDTFEKLEQAFQGGVKAQVSSKP